MTDSPASTDSLSHENLFSLFTSFSDGDVVPVLNFSVEEEQAGDRPGW